MPEQAPKNWCLGISPDKERMRDCPHVLQMAAFLGEMKGYALMLTTMAEPYNGH